MGVLDVFSIRILKDFLGGMGIKVAVTGGMFRYKYVFVLLAGVALSCGLAAGDDDKEEHPLDRKTLYWQGIGRTATKWLRYLNLSSQPRGTGYAIEEFVGPSGNVLKRTNSEYAELRKKLQQLSDHIEKLGPLLRPEYKIEEQIAWMDHVLEVQKFIDAYKHDAWITQIQTFPELEQKALTSRFKDPQAGYKWLAEFGKLVKEEVTVAGSRLKIGGDCGEVLQCWLRGHTVMQPRDQVPIV